LALAHNTERERQLMIDAIGVSDEGVELFLQRGDRRL
jgi:hypothetical protein